MLNVKSVLFSKTNNFAAAPSTRNQDVFPTNGLRINFWFHHLFLLFFVYNLTWFQQSKALSAGCQKNAEGPSWLPAATQLVSAIPVVAANFAKNLDCGAAGWLAGWLQVQVLSLLQLVEAKAIF